MDARCGWSWHGWRRHCRHTGLHMHTVNASMGKTIHVLFILRWCARIEAVTVIFLVAWSAVTANIGLIWLFWLKTWSNASKINLFGWDGGAYASKGGLFLLWLSFQIAWSFLLYVLLVLNAYSCRLVKNWHRTFKFLLVKRRARRRRLPFFFSLDQRGICFLVLLVIGHWLNFHMFCGVLLLLGWSIFNFKYRVGAGCKRIKFKYLV